MQAVRVLVKHGIDSTGESRFAQPEGAIQANDAGTINQNECGRGANTVGKHRSLIDGMGNSSEARIRFLPDAFNFQILFGGRGGLTTIKRPAAASGR